MKNIFAAVAFASGLLTASVSGAATLGLVTTGPVSSGSGGAQYDETFVPVFPAAFSNPLGDPSPTFDLGPLATTTVDWFWEGSLNPTPGGFDTVTIGIEVYDIEEVGFTETGTDDQLEFKLGSGTTFVDGALFILTGGFDFSSLDPFDQFSTDLLSICDPLSDPFCEPILDFTTVNFSVQGLDTGTAGTPVIPLPAPLLLMGTAMAGFAVVRRRKA